MLTTEPFLPNPHQAAEPIEAPRVVVDEVRRFHRSLAEYAVTPLVSLPDLAAEMSLGAVLVKDESSRLGLPAFKMLGASWAVHRALDEQDGASTTPHLVTATDGNHGRAVARMAALLGLPATVVVPRVVSEQAITLIRGEGAAVRVLDVSYDDAVRRAAGLADELGAVLVQDTSWPGYEDVPQWIVDGYATLFDEAAEQAADLDRAIDLVVVPTGVGSLAQAAVRFAARSPGLQVVTVEPEVADCVRASLAVGSATTVSTGETLMAGLNCGTPSYLAWPELRRGLAGAVAVDDSAVTVAMADLAERGVDSGPCGAASLAALRILAAPVARDTLGIGPSSTVLLLSTEGTRSTSGA